MMTPYGPLMPAVGHAERVLDAFRGQRLVESFRVRADERVVLADADPEHLQLFVDRRRIFVERREADIRVLRAHAHDDDVAEEVRTIEPEIHRLSAAHREARDRTVI